MSRTSWLTVASLFLALIFGFLIGKLAVPRTALAQNAPQVNQVLVHGHGRAVSRLAPPGERIELIPSTTPQRSFTVVPAGKKFVLTDVMYEAQVSVRQPVPVNIGNANPSAGKHEILFQFIVDPMKSDQVHLCTGYVVPAGNSLVAFTGHGPEPDQFVSIAVTGYLVDQ
jgi:hypothetical protein